jgi:pilus assembly protein CpaC
MFWLSLLGVFVTALVLAAPRPGHAQQRQVRVEVSSGKLIELPRPAKSVFIADPSIADIQVPGQTSVIVFGRKPGRTSLFAVDEHDKPIASIEVVVGYELADVQRLIRQELPHSTVTVASTPSGIVLSGTVPNADAAEKARAAAARYIGEKEALVNNLRVAGPAQVNLRVRVAEVQRSVTKQLGFNWEVLASPGAFSFGLATGRNAFLGGGATLHPPVDIDALINRTVATSTSTPVGSVFGNLNTSRATVNSLIDALAEEGLITILAEPNLTATSGQEASFLAGGEFPIPVAQNTGAGGIPTITIEFKQFGVSLDFVPTVLASNRISIKVRPEVSELTDQGAIRLSDITIPALKVRRAETTVELGSGQSFAIAGLIQSNSDTDISKYPGLGDVPILGPLFRSSRFQRSETELVIIVTPYVVRPVNDGRSLRLPTDGLEAASDVERIFQQRLTKAGMPADRIGLSGVRLRGDSGFVVE